MEIVFGFILIAFFVLSVAALSSDDDGAKGVGVFMICITIAICGCLFYHIGYHNGEEEGAYNMLHNEYNIRYIMSSDSVISDTIIMEFNEK